MMRPFIFGLALLLTGCTRVVDLDLPDGAIRLVVDARIELDAAEQRVVLTTTDAVGSVGAPPPARGAVVLVTDDAGGSFPFVESAAAGVYLNPDLVAAVGRRYTLTIDYQGDRYQAVQALVTVPSIDSLYFEYEEAGIAQGDSGFRAVIDYTDPPNVKNFYLWELYVDGERRVAVDPGNRFRVISDDEFYDGGVVVGYQPFDEEVVDPGQTVRLRQVGLSEEGYRYYFTLYEQTTARGGPFATPPASVRGNVANLTRPEQRALGFFLASAVAERIAVVPAR
jgi:hypothetical protein